jgi:hypothetical protein
LLLALPPLRSSLLAAFPPSLSSSLLPWLLASLLSRFAPRSSLAFLLAPPLPRLSFLAWLLEIRASVLPRLAPPSSLLPAPRPNATRYATLRYATQRNATQRNTLRHTQRDANATRNATQRNTQRSTQRNTHRNATHRNATRHTPHAIRNTQLEAKNQTKMLFEIACQNFFRDRCRPDPQNHIGSVAGCGGACPTGDPATESLGSTEAVFVAHENTSRRNCPNPASNFS